MKTKKDKPLPIMAQEISVGIIIVFLFLLLARHAFGSFEQPVVVSKELLDEYDQSDKILPPTPAPDIVEPATSLEGANFVKTKAEIQAEEEAKKKADVVVKQATQKVSPAKTTGTYITATVTMYSELDSCHYPKNGKCLMANGQTAYVGAIACSSRYKLGTKVEINGSVYTCADRYNEKLDAKRGTVTFDIWGGYGQSAHTKALQFGIKKLKVKILK